MYCQQLVTRHVWEEYMELAEDYRHTPQYKEIYDRRKETVERVFADAKEKHGMRYTRLRGLQKVSMQVTLTFACMNLKKLAKWKRKNRPKAAISHLLYRLFAYLSDKKCYMRCMRHFLSTDCSVMEHNAFLKNIYISFKKT